MNRKPNRTFHELFRRAEERDDYWAAKASLVPTDRPVSTTISCGA